MAKLFSFIVTKKAMKEPRLLMVTEISNSTCTNTPQPNLTNPATTKVEIHLTERSAHTVSFARRPPSEEVVLVKLSKDEDPEFDHHSAPALPWHYQGCPPAGEPRPVCYRGEYLIRDVFEFE